MILEVDGIYTAYGLSQVLFGVSLRVARGECVSLLGRNGMGKTTTMRSIMGLTSPYRGAIRWNGESLVGLRPHQIARRGIGFVPEDRRIFPDLTVWENLDVARRAGHDGGRAWPLERILDLFPALQSLLHRRGGHLSGGEQQMLTIARTLMGNPELLLLDEPSEGLAPLVVEHLEEQIRRLKREGMTILLAEQNTEFSLALADRAYVLDRGRVCYEGPAAALQADDRIRTQFLAV